MQNRIEISSLHDTSTLTLMAETLVGFFSDEIHRGSDTQQNSFFPRVSTIKESKR